MKLSGATYNTVVLRPINVYPVNDKSFTDATANGSKLNVFDLLSFDDWRGVAFENANAWLFAYYDVKEVKTRLDDMTTNAVDGVNFTKFDAVRAAFKMEGVKTMTWSNRSAANALPILNKAKDSFGTIVYDNTK